MVNERDYIEAQENQLTRGRFVKQIDLEWAIPYVGKVKYSGSNTLSVIGNKRGKFIMGTAPKFLSIIAASFRIKPEKLRVTRPDIIVFPYAFSQETHPNFDDFLSTLIDHEGEHARRCCKSLVSAFTLSNSIGGIEDEIEVHEHHLRKMDKRNCSDIYREIVGRHLSTYKELLREQSIA